MSKGTKAGLAALAVWGAIIWFTAWDKSPAEWEPEHRFVCAFVALFFYGAAAALSSCAKD